MNKGTILAITAGLTLATGLVANANDNRDSRGWEHSPIVQKVRSATAYFRHPDAAIAAGYIDTATVSVVVTGERWASFFLNPDLLFDDGTVDATMPEVLIYETMAGGWMRLVGVEFISIDDGNPDTGSPVLDGHLLNYSGAPNRYGLPAFHKLHVWAWKYNPSGTFADWNPPVACNPY